jgi:exosortase/archaeosortase family protein
VKKTLQASKVNRSFFSAGLEAKREGLVYAAKFCGILFLGGLLSLLPEYHRVLGWEATGAARWGEWILGALGMHVERVGATLFRGDVPVLEVTSRCSGVTIGWLLLAAIFAYPSARWAQITGFLAGLGVLLVVNVLRVVSLFWVGAFFPGTFDSIHEQYWPVLLIVVTVYLFALWLLWVQGMVKRSPWK